MKISSELQRLMDAYESEDKASDERSSRAATQVDELTAELAAAKHKLEQAIDATLEDPTAANEKAELEARKAVFDLELRLQGAQERKKRAFGFNDARKEALAQQAIDKARAEAAEYYAKKQPKAAQAVADAKLAYLNALADYHDLGEEAQEIYYGTGRQVGWTGDLQRIHIQPLYPFYRLGDRQIYGVSEVEIDRAYNRGVIERRSVEEGKERG